MTSRLMDTSPDDRCSSLARYITPMSRTATAFLHRPASRSLGLAALSAEPGAPVPPRHARPNILKLVLTFIVPYAVATYGAVSYRLRGGSERGQETRTEWSRRHYRTGTSSSRPNTSCAAPKPGRG